MSIIRRSLFILFACSLFLNTAFAKTGDTLKNDLRIILGQTTSTNSNWTDAQLYRCLNIAQDYIAGIGRVVETTLTIAGGNTRTAYPANFKLLRPGAFLWRNGKINRPLPVIALDSMYRIIANNSPQTVGRDNYYVADEGIDILVYPTTLSNDSIIIQYYAQPAVIDSGVECGFGLEWEAVLLAAAKAAALEKTRDQAWYDRAVAERDKMVAALYQQTKLKPQLTNVP